MSTADVIAAVLGGVGIQLVVFLVGYGAMGQKVNDLRDRFTNLETSIGNLHERCNDIISNGNEVAQRVSKLEGCLHAHGLGCGEAKHGEVDTEGNQETRST